MSLMSAIRLRWTEKLQDTTSKGPAEALGLDPAGAHQGNATGLGRVHARDACCRRPGDDSINASPATSIPPISYIHISRHACMHADGHPCLYSGVAALLLPPPTSCHRSPHRIQSPTSEIASNMMPAYGIRWQFVLDATFG
jgi:hypothetical protein